MYDILTVCNHAHFLFLQILLESIRTYQVPFRKLFLVDAGLLDSEKSALLNRYSDINVKILDNQIKNTQAQVRTQSYEYRDLIQFRAKIIKDLFSQKKTEQLLQVDADVAFLGNPFTKESMAGDIALTVRHASKELSIWNKATDNYPNIGVVFWNNPNKAIHFIDDWLLELHSNEPHPTQYEQAAFIRAMSFGPHFKNLDSYYIPCERYNCYKTKWLHHKPLSLHFKSKGYHETPFERVQYFQEILPDPLWKIALGYQLKLKA